MASTVSFLSLPAELRMRNYNLVGHVHESRIRISSLSNRKSKAQPHVKDPAVALVCRQVRCEVPATFYGQLSLNSATESFSGLKQLIIAQNIFTSLSRADIKHFLQHLPHSNLAALRRVYL
ncbi:hypothetical protein DOTSEDRAFT_27424 [Dothistroma septosporum NZE10]|uniref:F-box domain-containing protein n=1 Tax=Dothistroma septosporum (strain NZE10 / CBS 128990) TaxID=675120 RepID=N1PH05_DOTSN|nr:hypothetical protein DOTSEDRAFT_27424 [Dothistroma septosporum NZE10]